jgi:hypothetical protein
MAGTSTRDIKLSACVDISSLPYWKQSYTVERTGGYIEDGWIIDLHPHTCDNNKDCEPPAAHAFLGNVPKRRRDLSGGWRVHLHNGLPTHIQGDEHACGWRPLGTFWPTELTDKEDEIKAWTAKLRADIERLHEAQANRPSEKSHS